jgi:hypothetical protein
MASGKVRTRPRKDTRSTTLFTSATLTSADISPGCSELSDLSDLSVGARHARFRPRCSCGPCSRTQLLDRAVIDTEECGCGIQDGSCTELDRYSGRSGDFVLVCRCCVRL